MLSPLASPASSEVSARVRCSIALTSSRKHQEAGKRFVDAVTTAVPQKSPKLADVAMEINRKGSFDKSVLRAIFSRAQDAFKEMTSIEDYSANEFGSHKRLFRFAALSMLQGVRQSRRCSEILVHWKEKVKYTSMCEIAKDIIGIERLVEIEKQPYRAEHVLIKAAGGNRYWNAWGGSSDGAPIVLFGNNMYARRHANSHAGFVLVPTEEIGVTDRRTSVHNGAKRYYIKVADQDLYLNASGGAFEGAAVILQGGFDQALLYKSGSQFEVEQFALDTFMMKAVGQNLYLFATDDPGTPHLILRGDREFAIEHIEHGSGFEFERCLAKEKGRSVKAERVKPVLEIDIEEDTEEEEDMQIIAETSAPFLLSALKEVTQVVSNLSESENVLSDIRRTVSGKKSQGRATIKLPDEDEMQCKTEDAFKKIEEAEEKMKGARSSLKSLVRSRRSVIFKDVLADILGKKDSYWDHIRDMWRWNRAEFFKLAKREKPKKVAKKPALKTPHARGNKAVGISTVPASPKIHSRPKVTMETPNASRKAPATPRQDPFACLNPVSGQEPTPRSQSPGLINVRARPGSPRPAPKVQESPLVQNLLTPKRQTANQSGSSESEKPRRGGLMLMAGSGTGGGARNSSRMGSKKVTNDLSSTRMGSKQVPVDSNSDKDSKAQMDGSATNKSTTAQAGMDGNSVKRISTVQLTLEALENMSSSMSVGANQNISALKHFVEGLQEDADSDGDSLGEIEDLNEESSEFGSDEEGESTRKESDQQNVGLNAAQGQSGTAVRRQKNKAAAARLKKAEKAMANARSSAKNLIISVDHVLSLFEDDGSQEDGLHTGVPMHHKRSGFDLDVRNALQATLRSMLAPVNDVTNDDDLNSDNTDLTIGRQESNSWDQIQSLECVSGIEETEERGGAKNLRVTQSSNRSEKDSALAQENNGEERSGAFEVWWRYVNRFNDAPIDVDVMTAARRAKEAEQKRIKIVRTKKRRGYGLREELIMKGNQTAHAHKQQFPSSFSKVGVETTGVDCEGIGWLQASRPGLNGPPPSWNSLPPLEGSTCAVKIDSNHEADAQPPWFPSQLEVFTKSAYWNDRPWTASTASSVQSRRIITDLGIKAAGRHWQTTKHRVPALWNPPTLGRFRTTLQEDGANIRCMRQGRAMLPYGT